MELKLNVTSNPRPDSRPHSRLWSSLIWSYGISSYLVGVVGLLVLISALAGIIPLGKFASLKLGILGSMIVNIGLCLLFGLQHSIMARPSFKRLFADWLPIALERSTFVLASGLVLTLTVLFWQPLPGVLYQSTGNMKLVLWLGFAFGWLYLLAATFAINHFDLFGLRQVWFEAKSEEYIQVPFKENWMYRYSRHPIMLGALIGLWCTPTMTYSSLSLSLGMSIYIAVGLWFEERDLIRQWGQAYLDYKKRVRTLI